MAAAATDMAMDDQMSSSGSASASASGPKPPPTAAAYLSAFASNAAAVSRISPFALIASLRQCLQDFSTKATPQQLLDVYEPISQHSAATQFMTSGDFLGLLSALHDAQERDLRSSPSVYQAIEQQQQQPQQTYLSLWCSRILDDMERAGIEPTCSHLDMALAVSASSGDLAQAQALSGSLQMRGLVPSENASKALDSLAARCAPVQPQQEQEQQEQQQEQQLAQTDPALYLRQCLEDGDVAAAHAAATQLLALDNALDVFKNVIMPAAAAADRLVARRFLLGLTVQQLIRLRLEKQAADLRRVNSGHHIVLDSLPICESVMLDLLSTPSSRDASSKVDIVDTLYSHWIPLVQEWVAASQEGLFDSTVAARATQLFEAIMEIADTSLSQVLLSNAGLIKDLDVRKAICRAILRHHARTGNRCNIVKVLEAMSPAWCTICKYTVSDLVKGLQASSSPHLIDELQSMFEDAGIDKLTHERHVLLQALIHNGERDAAMQVFRQTLKGKRQDDSGLYMVMADLFVKDRDIDGMQQLVKTAADQRVKHYFSLVQRLVELVADTVSPNAALDTLHTLMDSGVTPYEPVISFLIDRFCRTGRFPEARRLFESFVVDPANGNSQPLSVRTLTVCLRLFRFTGNRHGLKWMLQYVHEHGGGVDGGPPRIVLDARFFKELAKYYLSLGNSRGCARVWADVQQGRIQGNAKLLRVLLLWSLRYSAVDVALEIWAMGVSKGYGWDPAMMERLVALCDRRSMHDAARRVIVHQKEMERLGQPSDVMDT
ncbi:hypothetical protein BC831DRAFT_436157 [Entophlyctis helioformis]|nr:hypothetical protein BC831DRAFT_436157 [Entophlyctis helioformis]